MTCDECGGEIPNLRNTRRSRRFCKDACRYKHRDRLRRERDPEAERERSRRRYAARKAKVA